MDDNIFIKNYAVWIIAVVVIMAVILVWFYKQNERYKKEQARLHQLENEHRAAEREKERLEYLAEERRNRQIILDNHLPIILEAARQVSLIKSGYLANYPYNQWLGDYFSLYDRLKVLDYSDLSIETSAQQAIKEIKAFYKGGESMRRQHNDHIIEKDLTNYKQFLDEAAGKPLDSQQRRAVITDEDNNLIIAGAGSGKTTTIVGKVKYVIDRYKVNPKRILLITFTSKSAESLVEKVDVQGVVAKTFHSFCLGIVGHVLGYKPSIFDANSFETRIRLLLEDRCKVDRDYKLKAANFFIEGLKIERPNDDFKSKGEYIRYLKEQNYRPLKAVTKGKDNKQTFRRETVKSKEECKIANFLYLNNVDYNYEAHYEYFTATIDHKQYQPDFTIRQGNQVVYLEHFGINSKGEVPKWFAKKPNDNYSWQVAQDDYVRGMKWKRALHQKHDTTLIETYSYENDKEGRLFTELARKLEQVGIEVRPKTPEEVWAIIKKEDENGYNSLIRLLGTFINLMKSNNFEFAEVHKRIKAIKSESEQQRARRFCDIIEPIFDDYQSYLAANKMIDFSDMINMATRHINEGSYQETFDYIIIDEFQDTSVSRYRLIEALKKQNPFCKLFCVGDDWQSIYRFAGSDIALFKNFDSYFGVTAKLKIETTYRYHEPLIKLSGDFILKNPNQSVKALRSGTPDCLTTYHIQYFNNFEKDHDALTKLDELLRNLLLSQNGVDKKEILLLGRYNFDKKLFEGQRQVSSQDWEDQEDEPMRKGNFSIVYKADQGETLVTYTSPVGTLTMKFMSVHKSKGLEADIVILLNCSSGAYGFPAQLSDDPILNLLLSDADQFENGEERRLFYVAMTRAKEQVYFLTDQAQKSKFITEFEITDSGNSIKKCPRCVEGDLILRTGPSKSGTGQYAFYGCSNFNYGCDYTKSASS